MLPAFKNVEGMTYAANESGCLVGVLAAKMAQKHGRQHDRRRRRHQDPAGRHLDRRLQVLRAKGRARARSCSSSTRTTSAPRTSARPSRRTRSRRARRSLPGRRRLRPRHAEGGRRRRIWGIGVDSDQYNDAKRVLTSGDQADRHRRLRHDQQAAAGKFQGGTDLVFNLKNNGVGVGKINPSVPKAWITLMNSYKAKIIAGTLKVPASL